MNMKCRHDMNVNDLDMMKMMQNQLHDTLKQITLISE